MTAKLMAILESAMYLAMRKSQYSAVAANAKVLMRLIGLDTQEVHTHKFKHGRSTANYTWIGAISREVCHYCLPLILHTSALYI